ncbi:bromodomain adjacent to zinc finger domain protein 2A isoform X2 [Denticeps clupeoides]|uniref:Bromodomain adjacent to zinc finger domain protein 2A n=1 Tax=Denticeps clupeoides TaxID=299321 RepID=A0AAY4D1D7_9TELE|nr:bromodomain adjacent to zinc finger domain protein 2A-like isoform X2 [Denticeps clupeoides]
MEANNHFNYGSHSSVSANSGLKLSSGDSHYTNGSSMSFPQQGKNINGDMNVNGITTAIGTSQAGSTSSYPHMSNHHHQDGMAPHYMWGQQYNPALSSGSAHSMHQKQSSPGAMPQQGQQHFQGHGQYQVNGGMGASRQAPVAGAANASMSAGQYWNRGNPSQHQGSTSMPMGYNSHSMYGAYQSQVHTGMPPAGPQHHQQPSMQHQSAAGHHHHPHPHHSPHHPPQQQHYGMVGNGMPFYQHQPQHPPLSSPPSQAQSQPQMMSPPRGSPQHHHMGRGGTSSPLHMPMMSPSAIHDSGSPQSRDSPLGSSVPLPALMQGCLNEGYKEVDAGYNGVERSQVNQHLPKADSFPTKPPVVPHSSSDYCQRPPHSNVDMDVKQQHDLGGAVREPVQLPVSAPHPLMSTPPRQAGSVSSQSLSTHQKASSESSSASGSPVASSLSPTGARKLSHGTPPSMSVQPPRLSSPPLMVQGLRSAPGPVPPSTMAGPAQLMAASPPSGPSQTGHITMPVTVPVTLPSALSVAGSSTSPQSTSSLSVPLKNLPPSLSPSFHSHLSSLSSLVQGPKPPEVSKPVMSAPPSEVCAPPAPALKDFPPSPKAQVLPHSAACSPQKAPDTVSVPTPASPPASGHLPSESCPPAVNSSSQVVSMSPPASSAPLSGVTTPLKAVSAPCAVSASPQALTVSPPRSLAPRPQPVSEPWSATVSSISQVVPVPSAAVPPPLSISDSAALVPTPSHSLTKCSRGPVKQAPEEINFSVETHRGKQEVLKAQANFGNTSFKVEPTSSLLSNKPIEEPSNSSAEVYVQPLKAAPKDTQLSTEKPSSFVRAQSTTFNDSLDSEDYTSVAESTCIDSSNAEDTSVAGRTFNSSLNDTSQVEDLSMFTENSIESSRDLTTEEMQTEGASVDDETMDSCMTTRDSTDYNMNNSQYDTSSVSDYDSFHKTSKCIEKEQKTGQMEVGEWDVPDSASTVRGIAAAFDVVQPLASGTAVPLAVGPQKPTSRTPKALKQGTQVSLKKTRVKVATEGKVKRKKKEEKEPAKQWKKRKTSKEECAVSGDVIVETTPFGEFPSPAQEPVTSDGGQNLSASQSPQVKPKKIRKPKVKLVLEKSASLTKSDTKEATKTEDDENDDSSTAGETPRRRIATEEQVHFPLLHGWRREVRVKTHEDRMKGETWYYSPCGRRMKQFPEVIKYLRRHQCGEVTREHFSFSPRMPVGDFYEERDSPEGMKWFLLANEEVPSMIMAITGRRGRPPNPDKEKTRPRVRREKGAPGRRPGRPPKSDMTELLSKVDARLLKRLEAKEVLTEEDKEKLMKIKKKLKRKVRIKKKEDAKIKMIKQEKRKARLEKAKELKEQQEQDGKQLENQQEEVKSLQQATTIPSSEQEVSQPALEPKKPSRRKRVQTEEELLKAGQVRRNAGERSKAKALARAQAEAEAQAQAVLAAKRQAERRAQAQKRLEERKRQQLILEEMKKPAEDMCLCDHQPLPELSRIAGVVLTGRAFSNCLIVVEFLHSYGKVLGLQVPKDVPSLSTLQEGILGVGSSQGEVLDLLIKLVDAALHDPGLPSYYQSVKILGEKLVDVELSHVTVSEALRIFLESNGFEMEVCKSLHIKNFQSLCPEVKASILAFLVEMLNASNTVIRDVDNTLENMATYRKNKWILEGKLRKLKAALVKRTGRSEEELCLEDRRRSTRGGMAEEESLEDIIPLERGSRRSRREETKLADSDSPTTASIAELERQIDKLTKRQVFFRKKLQQSSHSLRAISLGQDRYRRRYWVLPHVGGILVEGPEEILESGDILVTDEPLTPVKKEVKVEVKKETPLSPVTPVSNRAAATTTFHPSPPLLCSTSPSELDSLPGEASLMSSSPRGRGRPRKIKPEVELHLRAAKNRRRRRSSKSGGDEPVPGAAANGSMPDLTQSTFVSWLSQSQASVTNGAATNGPEAGGPDESAQSEDMLKETALLLPKIPCNAAPSLSEPSQPSDIPVSPTKETPPPQLTNLVSPDSLPPVLQPDALSPGGPTSPPVLQCMVPIAPVLPSVVAAPPLCSTPVQKPTRRRRRGSSPGRRTYSRSSAARRRGRPAAVVFQEIEQKFFTQLVVKPIPLEMVKGWWWVKEPAQLTALVQALHPRGARERVLHKHLTKHMEYLSELCAKPVYDPVFQQKVEEGSALLEALHQPWPELQNAIQADVTALQWVEDLEQRVLTADLQLKVYTLPEPDSTRQDLEFYEHEVDPRDDWIVKTKKEWSDMLRIPNNPLDLAVLRLANLERNIERRYLKEPLWNLSEVVRLAPLTPPHGEEAQMDVGSMETEITPRLRTWRQALDRCRSAAQLSLCLLQLERAIAWERSIVKVTCQICHKGDNDEYLLLCDGCDRGCHMFCLRPKVTQVPEGDWFCPTCVAKSAGDDSRPHRTARQRACGRKRRAGLYDSSEEDDCPRRSGGMSTRQKDGPSSSSSSGCSPSKRRRMTTRNQPDLTYCEIILMEMEAHADAWPFLEPVNPRLVPGYRRIIKNPMDFLTMRERLLQGGYCSCEEFAADAQLVFNNCELFNEDTSEVGMAGHSMRRFFESRWAEFYQTKDK